jgi:hypothetical protein
MAVFDVVLHDLEYINGIGVFAENRCKKYEYGLHELELYSTLGSHISMIFVYEPVYSTDQAYASVIWLDEQNSINTFSKPPTLFGEGVFGQANLVWMLKKGVLMEIHVHLASHKRPNLVCLLHCDE